jgi:dual specificity protein kinase YAK1
MDQWQPYSSTSGAPRRYNNAAQPPQPHQSRDYNSNGGGQPPAGYAYEQYQGGMSSASHTQSTSVSPSAIAQRDGNGDIAMQDAGDPYSGVKYPMRPHHQQHLSGASRAAAHQPLPEQSTAAQRYSPMETLSPANPYAASPQVGQNPYTSRQSPTRPGNYSSPNSYYTNRPQAQQLSPITPYTANNDSYPASATLAINQLFGNDPKSPRRPAAQPSQGPPSRGPVPEFTKVRSISDLQPKINAQPAFRRANPEGGFISVRTLFASSMLIY